MSRALDVVTLTGAEYDALTQRADDWYTLYARAAKERTAALEDVERWKRAAESNIEENVGLRLAEEGAKEAFGHVVQQKRDLDAECKRLRGLLDLAYDTIRRKSHNALAQADSACGVSPGAEGSAALVEERERDGNA